LIGLLLLSHGSLAQGLYDSNRIFVGDRDNIGYLVFGCSDDPYEFGLKIESQIKKLDLGDGVIVFVDIPGGSPANQAMLLMDKYPSLRVVTGMNLIMTIEASLFCDSLAIDELCSQVMLSATQSIIKLKKQENSKTNDNDVAF
jgi:mannose PTS system EIIA component